MLALARKRVRDRQRARYRRRNIFANAQIATRDEKEFCGIGGEAEHPLETAVEKLDFSARAYDRVLKVARKLADLAGEEAISVPAVAEAIQYRTTDR